MTGERWSLNLLVMTESSIASKLQDESRGPLRMRAVQDPVIPIVGELVKANPGTISLGQGVVRELPGAGSYLAVVFGQ